MESLEGHKQPRPVSESVSEMAEVVLPNDANPLNSLLGGRLMHFIDLAGAMAAHRHSRSYVVTASMDHIDFLAPVHVGDLLILRSSVNRAFRTSMEVGVKCWVENYIAGTRRHIASAYLTFVAVDNRGRRLPVRSAGARIGTAPLGAAAGVAAGGLAVRRPGARSGLLIRRIGAARGGRLAFVIVITARDGEN